PCSKALVVRVLELSFSFGAVKRRLETLWAKNGVIQVSNVANSFYLDHFADEEDYKRVAFGGPWKIYDYCLSVARWTPAFNEEEPLKTILTWVRLPRLLIQFFNRLAVSRIGNYIGRTVKIDMATSEVARARYARVCVEVDVSKPLFGKYMIDNRTFYVEYDSLTNICATCGFYGHKSDDCNPLPDSAPSMEVGGEEAAPKDTEFKGDDGDWMVVQRKPRGKARKESRTSSQPGPSVPRVDSTTDFGATPPPKTKSNPAASQKMVDPVTVELASNLVAVLSNAHACRRRLQLTLCHVNPWQMYQTRLRL
ncbi:hypothetical protein LINPERHAP1_LOCUS22903, partial [Linum perenne]